MSDGWVTGPALAILLSEDVLKVGDEVRAGINSDEQFSGRVIEIEYDESVRELSMVIVEGEGIALFDEITAWRRGEQT